jgi:hypothetical protein
MTAPCTPDEPVVLRIILTKEQIEAQFVCLFELMAEDVHNNAVAHGFWEADEKMDPNASTGLRFSLIHSEVSEALEAVRAGNPPDDKIPEFTSEEAELSDAVIRIMDYGKKKKLRLGEAILAKHKYNIGRPFKHGKNF